LFVLTLTGQPRRTADTEVEKDSAEASLSIHSGA
jgi:hypothetical protein